MPMLLASIANARDTLRIFMQDLRVGRHENASAAELRMYAAPTRVPAATGYTEGNDLGLNGTIWAFKCNRLRRR